MSKLVAVTILRPLLYDSEWRVEGDTLEMDQTRAQTLAATDPPHIAIGDVVIPQDKDEPTADKDDFELAGWPGDDHLKEAGITTVDQLRALIKEHGDAWPNEVKGVGNSTAVKIIQKLEETSN